MKQTLLLIRHGQTIWNAEQRLPGQLPGVVLSDKGKEQAERLAEALTILPISAIISSPLERAYDTAKFLAEKCNLPIEIEPDLTDTNVGRWAGQNYNELTKTDPEWKAYIQNPTIAPEGVETFLQVQHRVLASVERWRKKEGTGNYLVFVAHADVVKLFIAHYTGLEAGRAGILSIDNASVSIVELESENALSARVIAIGWSPRPGWLKPPTSEPQKSEQEEGLVHDKEEQKA